jgi:hypothetical protein
MRGRPNDIIKAREMRTKHAKRSHTCEFCGGVFYGNGGYAAHMRKEYFQRMPEMKIKWITVEELREEWRRRDGGRNFVIKS